MTSVNAFTAAEFTLRATRRMSAACGSVAAAMTALAPPAPDHVTSPGAIVAWHWDAGRLVLPATPDGTAFWPPSLACPGTGEMPLWTVASGLGTVYATTALHVRDSEPRNVAIVQLDEGPMLMTRIEGIPGDAVPIGLRVAARFSAPDETGARLPVFASADDTKP